MARNANNLVKMIPLDVAITSHGLREAFIVVFVFTFRHAEPMIRPVTIVTQVDYIAVISTI